MGENKGHGDKSPSYPELDDMGSAASRAGQSAGNRQSAGNEPDAGERRQNQQHGGQGASGNVGNAGNARRKQDRNR